MSGGLGILGASGWMAHRGSAPMNLMKELATPALTPAVPVSTRHARPAPRHPVPLPRSYLSLPALAGQAHMRRRVLELLLQLSGCSSGGGAGSSSSSTNGLAAATDAAAGGRPRRQLLLGSPHGVGAAAAAVLQMSTMQAVQVGACGGEAVGPVLLWL